MAIETVISTLSGHKKKRTFYKNLLIYAPTLIHDQTLKFITDHQDRPFFPFVLSVIPRAELTAPEEMMNKYVGKFKETPYQDVDDGPNYKIGGYMSQEHVTGTSKGRFCGDGGIARWASRGNRGPFRKAGIAGKHIDCFHIRQWPPP